MKRILLTAFFALLVSYVHAGNPLESLSLVKNNADFINLSSIPGVMIGLRYASTNNFTHTGQFYFAHHIASIESFDSCARFGSQRIDVSSHM